MKVKKLLGNIGKYLLADGRKVNIQDFKDGKIKPFSKMDIKEINEHAQKVGKKIMNENKSIKKKRGRPKKSFFNIENKND